MQFTVAAVKLNVLTEHTDLQLEKIYVSLPFAFWGSHVEWFVTSLVPKLKSNWAIGAFTFSEFYSSFTSWEIEDTQKSQCEDWGYNWETSNPLSTPHVRLEYCREKGRLNMDFRQSCDILHNIVKLMWSMQSLYCVPPSLPFPLHPPHFFLPQDRIISHISKTSKMAFQLLVFIDSLNFRKDHSGPFSLIMKTRGQ